MIYPDFFKFNSLVSVPLFGMIAYLLIRKNPQFSFSKHTVSKSILFLHHPVKNFLFRFNFIFKALLDLSFALYISQYFNIPLITFPVLSMMISALFFGSLAYFIEGKYSKIHHVITYTSGVFWAISQISLAQLTNDNFFILFTNILTLIVIFLAFGFMFVKKTNVFVQITCLSLLYLWTIIFIFLYL